MKTIPPTQDVRVAMRLPSELVTIFEREWTWLEKDNPNPPRGFSARVRAALSEWCMMAIRQRRASNGKPKEK